MDNKETSVTTNVTPETTNKVESTTTQIKEKIVEENNPDLKIERANPQQSIKEVESTTSNVYNNNEHIVIHETSEVQAAKNTVIMAKLENGTPVIVTNVMPDPIDINKKVVTKVNKKGKKIRVVTLRERITNFLLTLVLLSLIGVGGYYGYMYLYKNNPANFVVKNIVFEVGDEIPKDSSYYINKNDVSDLDYQLDLTTLEEGKYKVGTYTYTVKYGNTTKRGTITIKDTKAPDIVPLKKLEYKANTTITVEDILLECNDYMDCSYDIKNAIDNTMIGKQKVTIVAYDSSSNISEQEIEIKITDLIEQTTCQKLETYQNNQMLTKYIIKYEKDYTISSILKEVTNNYMNNSVFEDAKDKYPQSKGYIIKNPKDDERYVIKREELDSINKSNDFLEVYTYLNNTGYTCK